MATATEILLETGKGLVNLSLEDDRPEVRWAELIRQNIQKVAHIDDADELPSTITIDEVIFDHAPRRHSGKPGKAALAQKVAQLLYPSPIGSLGALIKYDKDVAKLKRCILQQRRRYINEATERNKVSSTNISILLQGPWDEHKDPLSLQGAPSLPMPVKIAPPEAFEPFFDHLRSGGTEQRSSSARALADGIEIEKQSYGTKALEFQKGVLYSDRRLDLCKMVLGPPNIGVLMESLKKNEFVTHFLLGNNIIGPYGAKVIAEFVKEFPDRMDTWYLAGNCIDAPSFRVLVNQWIKSPSVTNIWLKRNPLGSESASSILDLITKTPNLRTLDLDQTGFGDEGVTELFEKLSTYLDHSKPPALRHLYLSAVGIGSQACSAIGRFLACPNCALESLYISNNPIGSGLVELAAGLQKNTSITRLSMQSVGMTDTGAIALFKALQNHSTLRMLDVGPSFATKDLGSRYNYITAASTSALKVFIESARALQYLDLGQCPMPLTALNQILISVLCSPTLLVFNGITIKHDTKSAKAMQQSEMHSSFLAAMRQHLVANVKKQYGEDMTYDRFVAEEKRWLVSDKTDVRKIDSVYRNYEAALARRGLTTLAKEWPEDDTTLDDVMRSVGAVGRVCTKRQRNRL
jgi:Ran GTPase-activating protein (RanGAP) involved in mRNA processing and transport